MQQNTVKNININFTEGAHLTLITFNAKPPSLYLHNDIFYASANNSRWRTSSEWPQTWKTWSTRGFLWTWKTLGILCNLWGKTNKIVSVWSNICMTRSWGSNEQSLWNDPFITSTFCCDNLRKSIVYGSGKLAEFFSYFAVTLIMCMGCPPGCPGGAHWSLTPISCDVTSPYLVEAFQ